MADDKEINDGSAPRADTPNEAANVDFGAAITPIAPPASLKKCWTTLITNTDYLVGLLTLDYSLKKVGSKYPLVALYTDTFPKEGHAALVARGIYAQRIEYLLPKTPKNYSNDPRFYDCWSKLAPFSLTQFDRVVQLDSDMTALQNFDELFDVPLDPPELGGKGDRVFAAAPACVCNPYKKPHYPKNWIPANCLLTSLHSKPDYAQTHGADSSVGLGFMNGGLQVVNPSKEIYTLITDTLASSDLTNSYDFADQSLLTENFRGRWVVLSHNYNALRPTRECHAPIWRDDRVKCVHHLLSPKPWNFASAEEAEKAHPTHAWWWERNAARVEAEKAAGINDAFTR